MYTVGNSRDSVGLIMSLDAGLSTELEKVVGVTKRDTRTNGAKLLVM